jgi:hypothetical protein
MPNPCCFSTLPACSDIYQVHRQALAADHSQVMVVRAVQGAFCSRENTTKTGVCATTPKNVVNVMHEPLVNLEYYHQVRG